MADVVLPNLSFTIMGVLFAVHNELGPALLEKYYQRAIEKELLSQNIAFRREVPVAIMYRDEKIGKYFLDFIINDLIILEVKAQPHYSPRFFNQALAYLRQTNLPLALLVNFRNSELQYKRLINPQFKNIDLSDVDKL